MEIDDGEDFFEVGLTYRTLLVQIVFKNYNEIVIDHLKNWFANDLFIGKGRLFESGAEIALMFQNCVYDQLVEETSDNDLQRLLERAEQIAQLITADSKSGGRLEKLFGERQIYGKTYDVKNLILLAQLKFAITVLTKLVYSQEAFEMVKGLDLFDSFNAKNKNDYRKTHAKN